MTFQHQLDLGAILGGVDHDRQIEIVGRAFYLQQQLGRAVVGRVRADIEAAQRIRATGSIARLISSSASGQFGRPAARKLGELASAPLSDRMPIRLATSEKMSAP